MRGHIRKRGSKSWAIVLDLGYDAEGKRQQKWHSVKGTKRDAETELTRLIRELDTGTYVEPQRITVAQYLKDWLADMRSRISAKIHERYSRIVRADIVPALGHIQLAKLKPLQIQKLYSELLATGRKDGTGGLSPRTVVHTHRILHKALDQAVKWQLLFRKPTDFVQPPRAIHKPMTALDEEQTAALLKSVRSTRLYLPTALAVSTGMRRGEILGLHWAEVDLERAQLRVAYTLEQTKAKGLNFKPPKTPKSRRQIALPQIIVQILKAHRREQNANKLRLGPDYEDHDLVCARPDGKPWPPQTFSTRFAAHIRSSGLPHVRFHDLRHTHATQLLKNNVHPKVVSERLGHSTIAITLDTYSHVLPGMQEQAVAALEESLKAVMKVD